MTPRIIGGGWRAGKQIALLEETARFFGVPVDELRCYFCGVVYGCRLYRPTKGDVEVANRIVCHICLDFPNERPESPRTQPARSLLLPPRSAGEADGGPGRSKYPGSGTLDVPDLLEQLLGGAWSEDS